MKGSFIKIIPLVALSTFLADPVALKTEKAFAGETCTYNIKGKTSYSFSCRWMIDGQTRKTIFVDNNDTGDRYEVAEYEWRIGPASNCISKYAAKVCTKKWW